jgi:hypothetical protein
MPQAHTIQVQKASYSFKTERAHAKQKLPCKLHQALTRLHCIREVPGSNPD